MLSYRHAFHAGNHADVLKHWIYSLVLDYFNQKDKPYWVIDTHAGAGIYQLASTMADKTAEYRDGIARLAQAVDRPQAFAVYMAAIQVVQNAISPQVYPGSPAIASGCLRANDKLRLFELHPADHDLLSQHFSPLKKQVQVMMKDGFEGVKSCLPPPTKRGLVLIDPPYELKEDYQRVVDCIKDSLKRFATGTYLIWYPMLQRPEPAHMVEKLLALQTDYVHVTLQISQPHPDGFGMFGSGMLILNPPWTLADQLRPCLPWLASTMAQDNSANAQIQVRIR